MSGKTDRDRFEREGSRGYVRITEMDMVARVSCGPGGLLLFAGNVLVGGSNPFRAAAFLNAEF